MKFAPFAFRKEPMCFIHVLLNALQLNQYGHEVKVVLEGESVALLPELYQKGSSLYMLFQSCLEKDLIGGVCKACSMKFETYEFAKEKGLPILEDMSNHAGMAPFIEKGFSIITF
jgi:hypothetical protein